MEERGEGSNKIKGIRQIVRLKGIIKKWQNVTIGKEQHNKNQRLHGGIPPKISRRLRIIETHSDTDEEHGSQSPEPSHDVPKGCLAVYVGPELRRFIIPTSYLGDPLFKVLLEKVEEEFGFDHSGALTIPCETETFKYLMQCMDNHLKENTVDSIHEDNNNTGQSPERIESFERKESSGTSLQSMDE